MPLGASKLVPIKLTTYTARLEFHKFKARGAIELDGSLAGSM